ncbi:MAG TPA: ATP-binding protein [Verrucomicrobiae bacterium]|jgi:SpoVK/Ycf46/Vps4 family AAA+-type ATPase
MPKTRELIELFRAIGSHDLTQAATLSRKLAAQRGARGQFRAERDLLGALNGMAKPSITGQPAMLNAAWSVNGMLMQLPASKRLDQLELSPAIRKSFGDVIKEWKSRDKLVKHGLPRRWRLLFHGPSGCGKSAAAAALASEMKMPGFLVRFDSLIGAYLGQTALRLRELFSFAAQTPCVLLFDEVDALAKRRGSPMEVGELDRIVIAFMQELEHAHADGFIIATSNMPKALDDALWRRFDLRVSFPKPTGKDLARFARHRSQDFGIAATSEILAQCRKAASYAEAEQLVISEARRRVLMT